MKNFLIFLMVFVSLTIAKEIKIDKIYKSVKISNETVLYEEAKTFCEAYNDTTKKQFRCYINRANRASRPYRIEIIEYDCPHLLPAPLAQYYTDDKIRSFDFYRWSRVCAENQNFGVHRLDNGRIEFIKRRDKIKSNITFTKIKEGN